MCLLCPEPLVSLVLRGAWHELLCLARWSLAASMRTRAPHHQLQRHVPRPFGEWPPAVWMHGTLRAEAPSGWDIGRADEPPQFSAEWCKTMASDIRRWAGTVLAGTQDPDAREQERRALAGAAATLDFWRAGFLEKGGELRRPKLFGRLHTSGKLVACTLMAGSLRSGQQGLATTV